MKFIGYIISLLTILGITVYTVNLGFQSFDPTTIKTSLDVKQLSTTSFIEYVDSNIVEEVVAPVEEDLEEDLEEEVVLPLEEETRDEEVVEEEPVSVEVSKPVSDVLETQVGSMSGYGPDCKGCSGYLANGLYVGDGTIYYSDAKYGSVRILAGDRSYPEGTIVRVKNSKLSEFIGIVLDRGGSIGFGKAHLFDLLYPSQVLAAKDEVSYNVTFEILRYGY